jgi:acyl-coenzyme A synthetase/AMP-(fatty) acid ligase
MLEEHSAVLEAGVVAVADNEWGERPKAYVTAKPGAHVDGNEVIEWVKHNGISKFMVPREVEMVGELPKTSTGKIKKGVLRGWAKGGDKRRML